MKNLVNFLSLVGVLLLVSCDQQGGQTVDQEKTAKQKWDAFLKLKNIDEQDEEGVQQALLAYNEDEALVKAIEQSGRVDMVAIDAQVAAYRRNMIKGRYFERYLSEATDEDNLQAFYDTNIERYTERKAHVAHILFRVNQRMDKKDRRALLEKANAAHQRSLNGEDFAVLAKELSSDKSSAVNGGDLGWVNEKAVAPEFAAVAFSLQAGEVSEPVLTSWGYHVVKLLAEPKPVAMPLAKIKGDIRQELRKQRKQDEEQRLLQSVSAKFSG